MSLNDYDKLYDEKKAVLKLIREPFYWIEELTDRQREALNLACRGIRGEELAEKLGLRRRAALELINRAVTIINKAGGRDIKPKQLPDLILKLIENELGE
jgi:predicted DNA binding protein